MALRSVVASYVPDVLMIAGVAGLSYGASLIFWPAGFIVGGLFTLAGGVLTARSKS